MNAESELPAIPVNLRSGFTQRLTFLPSKKTFILVFGLSLLIANCIGVLLAKNWSAVDTRFPLTFLVCNPLPTSLFWGLILEELDTEAKLIDDWASCVLTPPKELIELNDGAVPTQLTTNELCKLEKLSLISSLARKIVYKLVFVSTTNGSILWSYHVLTFGDISLSPTYWITTNGFGFKVFDAKSFPNRVNGE